MTVKKLQEAFGTLFQTRQYAKFIDKANNGHRTNLAVGYVVSMSAVAVSVVWLVKDVLSSSSDDNASKHTQHAHCQAKDDGSPTASSSSKIDLESNLLTRHKQHTSKQDSSTCLSSMADISRQLQKLAEHKPKIVSWVESYSEDPWKLLSLCISKHHAVRLLGVKALASQHDWHDAQFLQIAQACDMRTLVGLARTEGSDLRLFRSPPKLHPDKDSTEDKLGVILSLLPLDDMDKCVEYFTKFAAKAHKTAAKDEGELLRAVAGHDGSFAETLSLGPEDAVETFWLYALASHSENPKQCKEIARLGGLPLLHRIYEKRAKNLQIQTVIAHIIGNLALHEDVHPHLYNGGWVTILAHWIRSENLKLRLHAARALANLDRDVGRNKYEGGIFLVWPEHRSDLPLYADVVFIHGLRGGAFLTWRQGKAEHLENESLASVDNAPPDITNAEDASAANGPDSYTSCWPKDWLPKDLPNCRVLMVAYETFLSDWGQRCPYETEKRSIHQRSVELLRKLKKAGVGNRPIIFVTHSMGGLIVKQMLVDAMTDLNHEKIFLNTKGVVFYSTPHRGSSLATISNQAKYILFPSVEVKELKSDSEALKKLHTNFVNIANTRGISCLSIGENRKSSIGLPFQLHIVPPDSADARIGDFHLVDADHLYVCKPASAKSKSYRLLVDFVLGLIPLDRIGHFVQASTPPDPDQLLLEFFHIVT